MQYFSSKKFDKQFAKLPKKTKNQCLDKIEIFIINPYAEILNNHGLSGAYKDCRSIRVSGDIRIIYELVAENTAHFLEVGSHSELYK